MEVQAVWKKNYQVEVRARQFRVPVDEAPEYGGEDTGMMPTEMLLCALASCFCLAIVYVAKKNGLEIPDLQVIAKGKKDLKNFSFSHFTVEVKSSMTTETLEGLVNLARKYCFVSNTIITSCPIEYKVMS